MNRKTTFKFKEWQIRAAYDHEGKIRLNLNDLCDILKRDDLIRNGEAVRLCPSSLKILFRKNGKELWSILPADVQNLMRLAWKESNLPHSLLRELETWANQLFEDETPVLYKPEPVTFHFNDEFPVTFQILGERIMVNSTQITMQFGKLPSEWLRIASTDALRRDMEKAGVTGNYENQIFTTRGRGKGATWLEAPLAIALATWISPQSDLADWCADCVRRLETHGAPVSVRKRPVTKPKQTVTPQLDMSMPDNLEHAIKIITELRAKIEEDAPKLSFYEEFIENRDSFKSTRIADELKISPHQLHQFLFEEKICKYENKRWVVFNAYRSWQCDYPYAWTDSHGKTYIFGSTKRWTHAGRENIIELWKQKHPETQI